VGAKNLGNPGDRCFLLEGKKDGGGKGFFNRKSGKGIEVSSSETKLRIPGVQDQRSKW